jgi:glycosyltransferase involved in cell wall biosynthesis
MPPLVNSVLAIPLGEASPAQVDAAIARHFGAARVTVLERDELRRRPLRTLARLWTRRFDAALLLASDLSQPRLRLTSPVLVLARTRTRWRIDLHGTCQRWTATGHLASDGWPVVRHLAACGLAFALSEPLLRLLTASVQSRKCAPGRQGQRASKAHPLRKKRILYLRSQLWLGLAGGGSVAHTAGVIGGLEAAGAEAHVVASDSLPGVEAATHVIRPEVWFDGWARELEELAYNVAFSLAALRAARGFAPDLIYQRHTAFNVSGAILSRALRRPLVLEFNSSEVWKGRFWGGLRLERAADLVERINLYAADRVIVVSRVLRDELVSRGFPAAKIVVNPNAVDTAVFRPDLSGQHIRQQLGATSDVVIGFSGTFGAWHGIPTLAAALPLVLQARPDARWLLLGDGPLRPLVDQAVDGTPFADRVARVGMQPHSQMPEYLAACDVLVSPHGKQSDGGEFFGSPTKLYEYMAMGRPIVASHLGQIAEVLADGESALLAPPDDPEALASAIVRLIDDSCLRARLGQTARAAAEARHTWQQNAARVLACLEPGWGTVAEHDPERARKPARERDTECEAKR